MKISESAVRNPQLTLLLFLMAVIVGAYTILNMPRSEDPEVRAPFFSVVIIYPGTSPKDMENLAVNPIEKKLSGLQDIQKVKTEIRDGVAVILVEFRYGSNIDTKYQEVTREVNNIRRELPAEIYSIDVQEFVPSDVNILQIAVLSDNAHLDQLRTTAEELKDRLSKISQLKNVEIHGLPKRIVRVALRFDKMHSMHIPIDAVLASIQSDGVNIPGGRIKAGTMTFNVKTNSDFSNLDEIKNTIVYAANKRTVSLKDVADVAFAFEEDQYATRLNSHRCVFVVAALKPGENISQTQHLYVAVIEQSKKEAPSNIDVIPFFDQADNVNKRLGGLGVDFLLAIGLVGLTLLPLGSRATLIVMISIPLSLAIGITLLSAVGFTLNQLSIVGLVVSLGLLVDDSIVVIENIERWIREGHTRLEASIKATKQIGLAVLGCTATLIVAFLPLVFLPEASGDFIRNLPAAVIASVLASLLVSLTIIPFLSSKLLKEHHGAEAENMFLRILKRLIRRTYAVWLSKALSRPLGAVAVTVVLFVGSLALLPVIGFSLFPASEKPQFMIDIMTPAQSNIDYTNQVTREVEAELQQYHGIKYIAANVGKGNPQVYYNIMQKNESSDFAQIFVQMDGETTPSEKLELITELQNKWSQFPGARIQVKNFQQGMMTIAPVEVRISGDNLDTLRALATQVEQILKSTEGTMYVDNPLSNPKTDIRLDIHKQKARVLGVPTIGIARTVRLAVAGHTAGRMTDEKGKDFDIVVSKKKEDKESVGVLDNTYIASVTGPPVPLSQVATLELESSPISIKHVDRTRSVAVSSFVKEGYLNDDVNQKVIASMEKAQLPPGYRYEMGGEVESRNRAFGGFGAILIVTVFLFIMILVLEFKTFRSTLIVLSVIPLGIIGAVLALLMTGNSLSFIAAIGLVALAGIEVKNTILLVDFTNQLRLQGMPLDEAIQEAGEVRFLPIVLTSLTAIGGLIPIALSTNPLISPLAIVIIGGLVSSTLLSRVITPVVYKLIPPQIATR